MLKNPGFNNSEMARNRQDGGYDINRLLERRGFDPLSDDLASFFQKEAEMMTDEELQNLILRFANALYGACKLHAGDIEERRKKKIRQEWYQKLKLFMEDKEQELFSDDPEDYDVRPDVFYSQFYPTSYKEFIRDNPMPSL